MRPGFKLGSDGRILEWDREYKEYEPGHRHMSHLYGFHPGDQVTLSKTPLFDAVRKTLDYRPKKWWRWNRLESCLAHQLCRTIDGWELWRKNTSNCFLKNLFSQIYLMPTSFSN